MSNKKHVWFYEAWFKGIFKCKTKFKSTQLEEFLKEANKHLNDLQHRNLDITKKKSDLERQLCQNKCCWENKKYSGWKRDAARPEVQNKRKNFF